MSAQNTRCGVRGRRGVPRGWLSPLRRTLSRRRYGVWPTMALPLQIATMALLCCCAFGLSCAMCDEASYGLHFTIDPCSKLNKDPVNCTRKLFVLLSYSDKNETGGKSVHYVESAVDWTANVSGLHPTRKFKKIRFEVTRGDVLHRYYMLYTRRINSKPYEELIHVDGDLPCVNDPVARKSTPCGAVYDGDRRVIYSEGLCCDCASCKDHNQCTRESRAYGTCNASGNSTIYTCLRMGPNWYSAYFLGVCEFWYTIHIVMSLVDDPSYSVSLHLNTSHTVDESDSFGVVAGVPGNMEPADRGMDFTSHILFVPTSTADLYRQLGGVDEWMIVNESLVALEGTGCNMIGYSYVGFYYQKGRCTNKPGSCLANQLDDYRAADIRAVKEHRNTTYRASSYRNFSLKYYDDNYANVSLPYLTSVITTGAGFIISVYVDADKLQYIDVVEPGAINANMTLDENNETARVGAIHMNVSNIGSFTANFTVTVADCSEGILPSEKLVLAINPRQMIPLSLYVNSSARAAHDKGMCIVRLYNSRTQLISTKNVTWDVTASDDSKGTINNGDHVDPYYSGGASDAACTDCSFANVWCSLVHRCWLLFAFQFSILVLMLLLSVMTGYVLHQTTDIYQHVSSLMTRLRRRWGNAPGAASGVSKAVASTAPAAQQVQPEMCLGASTEQHTTAPLYDYYSDTTRTALSEPYAVPPAVHADSPSPCRCSGADAHSLPAATVPAHSSSADQLHTVARATETDSDHEPDQYHDGAGGSNVTPAANLDATVIDKPPS